jgi:Pyridoxamine 5'-phosphate oxidase
MELEEYFKSTKGRGVLATSDKNGKVNLALYAQPYFMDENTVTFIMAERLTHANLVSNPWAAYLFTEEEWKSQGKRLYLRKIKEEKNPDLLEKICRECNYSDYETGNKYVVYFNIENVLPLIGSEKLP